MLQLFTRRNIIIGLLAVACIVSFFTFYTYKNIRKTVAQTKKVDERLNALQSIDNVIDDLLDIESGQRGYIISRDTLFLSSYHQALRKLQRDTVSLRELMRQYPDRKDQFDHVMGLVDRKTAFALRSVNLVQTGKYDSAMRIIQYGEGRALMDSIRDNLFRMEEADRLDLIHSNGQRKSAARSSVVLLLITSVLLVAALVWLSRRLLWEERTRRENEKKIAYMASLTEQTNDAIVSTDEHANILSWNEGAEKLFGYKRDEVIGKFMPSVTRSGTSLERITELSATLKEKGGFLAENTVYDKQGSAIHVLASVTQFRGEGNYSPGFVIVLRDITERKKTEQLLENFNKELSRQVEEKTELVKNIVERVRDGFFSLDKDWCFTYVNDAAAREMQSMAAGLTGINVWDKFPEGRNTVAYEVFNKAIETQETQLLEFFYEPFQKWFMLLVYPSATGLSVLFRDISEVKRIETELARSNERFDLIAQTTNDAVWEWNLETGELWGNEMHQRLYGLEETDAVPKENEWLDRLHPEDRDILIKKQNEALESDTNVFITEYRFRTEDRGYRDIYDRCYIVRNKKGKAIRMLGSMMDVTERKRAETQFRDLLESAPDAMVIVNEKGEIVLANHQTEVVFGYSKEELISKPVELLLPLETGGEHAHHRESYFSNPTTRSMGTGIELSALRKNGSRFPVEVSFSPIETPQGRLVSAAVRDITERKKAEEANRAALQLLKQSELIGKTGYWNWDVSTNHVSFSEGTYRIFGEVQGGFTETLDDFIRRVDAANVSVVHGVIKKALEAKKVTSHEFWIFTPAGEKKFIATTAEPQFDSDGNVSHLFGTATDLTERKKAEEKIRENEAQYRALVENAVEALVVMDMDTGKFVSVSESAAGLFKMSREELLKTGPVEVSPEFQPDGQRSSESAIEKITKAIEGEKPSFEWTHRDSHGNLILCEVRLVRLPAEDRILIRGSIIDISERKKAEQAIIDSEETRRLIMNSALDAIVCINTSGYITVWTPQAEKIFGWSEQEVMGKKLSDTIIPEQYRKRHEEGMQHYQATGEGPILSRQIEIMALHRNGQEFPVELAVIPVKEAGNEFFCAFIRDITVRKQAEEKFFKEKELSDTAINSLPGIFYMFDINRKFLRWNKNFEIVSGYNQEELKNISPVEFFAEEDRLRATQKVEETFMKGMAELEASFLTKSGKKIPYYFTGRAILYEGKPCMLGTGIDIAQLRKTQEDYGSLVNTIEGIVWEADPATFQFSFVSEQAEKLLGYPVERWMNDPGFWQNHIHPEDQQWAVDYCVKCTAELKGHEFEYRMIAADGRTVWFKDIVSVAAEDGKPAMLRGIMIDITEKKIAEEEILRTNARFQVVSKATSDIVWDLNLVDDRLWWNDNYYTNLGYTKRKELVDLDEWFDHIHPDEKERVRTKFLEAIASAASSWRDEYRYLKADGTYLHILDRGYIMRNEQNKPYRMIGSMVDMTPVYQVQKRVLESENRLRTILDTDPECIKLLDADCMLLDINQAGLNMIEADNHEQVLGQSLLVVVAEEQKKMAAELVKKAYAGEKGRLEFEMVTLKNRKRWCEVNFVPLRNAEGEIVSVLGVTRDMSERKEAEKELTRNEEKYRTLVEQAADAIALYDAAGRILDVNTGAVKLLGYSKKELGAMFLKDILTPEEVSRNPVRYDVLQQGRSTVKWRKMKRKDGTIVETEVRSQQLPDGRFLSVIRDLTERIKAEQELQNYYKQLKELNSYLQNVREEERSNIAREIHDELGQQLTVLKMDISWLSKKLEMEPAPPNVRERLQGLLEMVDNTVKSVRRISSELRPSMLDDLGLSAAIEWHTQEFKKRSGLTIDTSIDPIDGKLPGKVAITLFRVFQESLTNVARHADASHLTINLKLKDDRLMLMVQDNGKGFLMKDIESKKTLGILGMKERIAIIQGEYDIQSVPGKGTTVTVSVPLKSH